MKYYLDTEFDGPGGALISLALVREDGKSTYFVMNCQPKDPWVLEHVIPIIHECPVRAVWCNDEGDARTVLINFFKGDDAIHVIADWPSDFTYFTLLLITEPGEMIDIEGLTMEVVRVDAYPTELPGASQHNAYWDAMALKHKLTETSQ